MECGSLFYLSSGSCFSCSSSLEGCSHCSNSTICLGCDGGYYLNATSCTLCSKTEGCLICNGSSSCLTCASGYFNQNSTCVKCSSVISNCHQCSNQSTCINCNNMYQISATGDCQFMAVSGSSSNSGPPELAFRTYYLNMSTLKHALSVADKSSKFRNIDQHDWSSITTIYL